MYFHTYWNAYLNVYLKYIFICKHMYFTYFSSAAGGRGANIKKSIFCNVFNCKNWGVWKLNVLLCSPKATCTVAAHLLASVFPIFLSPLHWEESQPCRNTNFGTTPRSFAAFKRRFTGKLNRGVLDRSCPSILTDWIWRCVLNSLKNSMHFMHFKHWRMHYRLKLKLTARL